MFIRLWRDGARQGDMIHELSGGVEEMSAGTGTDTHARSA